MKLNKKNLSRRVRNLLRRFKSIKFNLMREKIMRYIYLLPVLPGLRNTKLLVFISIVTIIIAGSLRGVPGNPNTNSFKSKALKEQGPFELSPERGRFALTYSLVENHSVFFPIPLAQFAAPDLGFWNGKFVSLFAPGVSLLVLPGYLIGKSIGFSQVGTFAIIGMYAVANMWLIVRISEVIGAKTPAAKLASLIFLFATPAYAYAVNLYQHQISTFLILSSIWLLVRTTTLSWRALTGIWFLCATSLLVDYPNVFLMLPIGLSALSKIGTIIADSNKIQLSIKPILISTFVGILLPMAIFLTFNFLSYGNPTRLAGSVPYVAQLDDNGKPVTTKGGQEVTLEILASAEAQSSLNFFHPRNIVNGLYTHILSFDRGVILYTPIMLFGLLGIFVAHRARIGITTTLLGVAIANIILYSMWGDPWGGWAFGSRYLIPGYAILSIFLGLLLTKWRKSWILLSIVLMVSLYSVGVNTMGALTTNANPPKVQVLALEKLSGHEEKYTFLRNYDILKANTSKSFIYNAVAKQHMSAFGYYLLISGTIGCLFLFYSIQLWMLYRRERDNK